MEDLKIKLEKIGLTKNLSKTKIMTKIKLKMLLYVFEITS